MYSHLSPTYPKYEIEKNQDGFGGCNSTLPHGTASLRGNSHSKNPQMHLRAPCDGKMASVAQLRGSPQVGAIECSRASHVGRCPSPSKQSGRWRPGTVPRNLCWVLECYRTRTIRPTVFFYCENNFCKKKTKTSNVQTSPTFNCFT